VLRGVPTLSSGALGLYRIVLGLGLLLVVTWYSDLSVWGTVSGESEEASWFVQAEWVRALADDPVALQLVEVVTVTALVCFVLGLRLEAIGGTDAFEAAYQVRAGDQDVDTEDERALQRDLEDASSAYQDRYGEPLGRVWVVGERLADYDWERAEYGHRVLQRRTRVIEPSRFEVASADDSR